ncbi:hypothetical protein [Sulfitobacter sabulilitoris]|uniref:Uncharacterized protein n=1 Tax=Sulfitobacter sabulilitoris TaxID=2562655 RepID=A0A5S3P8B6_9RHOB|nr:hypothetical protein [Sulfitobacter sabulilitoris]TMM48643.1 hypothetical protein FDT80_18760 [Sulfitobacter sabulilitoris]
MNGVVNRPGFWPRSVLLGLSVAITTGYSGRALADLMQEPLTIEDGAKVMVCDQIGFLSIVRGIDGELMSPQFPRVEVQHADGLFALIEKDANLKGMRVNYTSFLKFQAPETWVFTGFQGTTPFQDSCQDITGDLAFSFSKIAVATSWGMPHIEERVRLFEAMMDDKSTRLELAVMKSAALDEANAQLRSELDKIKDKTENLQMASCSGGGLTLPRLVEASLAPESKAFEDREFCASTLFSGCLTGTDFVVSTDITAQ